MYWNVPGLIITVSVKVLTGTVLAYPALTQTTGVTYDIALYKVDVTDAGVCTLTDERKFASPFVHRQGGSATNWSTQGTTNYQTGKFIEQYGVKTSSDMGDMAVTFQVPFSDVPIIFIVPVGSSGWVSHSVLASAAADHFDFSVYDDTDSRIQATAHWIAIGPIA